MQDVLKSAAVASLGPKIVRNFKWSWVLYGVAAYYGIKYLNKRGILPKQTGALLGVIDHGIDAAKSQVGLAGKQTQNQISHVVH
ncbi:MAG: hypothetical protein KF681_18080 [Bdellovibrionaceae bacterium]|nr:hypothetical protein [Pseudobdellovibrionaceae bacterium]